MIVAQQPNTANRLDDFIGPCGPDAAAETVCIAAMLFLDDAIQPMLNRLRVDRFLDPIRKHFARCSKSHLTLYGAVDAEPIMRLAIHRFHDSAAIGLLMDDCNAIAPGLNSDIIGRAVAWIGGRR